MVKCYPSKLELGVQFPLPAPDDTFPIFGEGCPARGGTRWKPRKKNTPCISDLAGVKFLLKSDEAKQNYFCGGKMIYFASANFLETADSVLDLDEYFFIVKYWDCVR